MKCLNDLENYFHLFQVKATLAAMTQLQMLDVIAPNSPTNLTSENDDGDASNPDVGPGPSKKRKIKTEDGQSQVKPDPDEKKVNVGKSVSQLRTRALWFSDAFAVWEVLFLAGLFSIGDRIRFPS